MYYDHRGNENNSTKVLEMFLDLPTLGTAVESAALMVAYRLLRLNLKNLGIGHNRIWAKADKMDNKFNMIKDHVTLRRMFGKYRTVIQSGRGVEQRLAQLAEKKAGLVYRQSL